MLQDKLNRNRHIYTLLQMYGSVLTTKQQKYLNDYYDNDLSLMEIAKKYDVSRSAILLMNKKSIEHLQKLEDQLNFIEKALLLEKAALERSLTHQELLEIL